MHRRWNTMIKQQKTLMQKIKNSKGISEYFNDLPEDGYMKDNLTKKHVLISDCKTSTLRRYDKLMKKYYNLCQTSNERKIISDKHKEIIDELNTRPDAIITHEDD